MPEITAQMWLTIIPILGSFLITVAGYLVTITVWKTKREDIDLAQNSRLDKAEKDIIKVSETLTKMSEVSQAHAGDIQRLRERNDAKDKTLEEIQKSLKALDQIPGKIESLEQAQNLAINGLRELLEEKISNVKEKVSEVKAPAPKRIYSKRTSTKVTK